MDIQTNISLKEYTTFKTGGAARYFCEVNTKKELADCISWTKEEKANFFCLGGGSNLLINDLGFNGLVIKVANSQVRWEGDASLCGAGVLLTHLIDEAKTRGLGGLEWIYGVPATLGGATRNNAGAFGSSISSFIETVEVYDTEKNNFIVLPKDKCGFSYHKSVFHEKPGWIIWEIILTWEKEDGSIIKEKINDFFGRRKMKQPLEYPSAGSFFRNPSETRSAGRLIEEAGLKGRRIGGAQVSDKHANFIINTGNAKTEDIVMLASIIKQKVRTRFKIQLHEEVEYVGFD